MGCFGYSRLVFNAVHCFIVICVLDARPILIVGLLKLVSALQLACLLAFVVVHSSNICRLITASLGALPVSYFPLVMDRRIVKKSQTKIAVPSEPSLSTLFQRLPPVLSL